LGASEALASNATTPAALAPLPTPLPTPVPTPVPTPDAVPLAPSTLPLLPPPCIGLTAELEVLGRSLRCDSDDDGRDDTGLYAWCENVVDGRVTGMPNSVSSGTHDAATPSPASPPPIRDETDARRDDTAVGLVLLEAPSAASMYSTSSLPPSPPRAVDAADGRASKAAGGGMDDTMDDTVRPAEAAGRHTERRCQTRRRDGRRDGG
jgi:hypothetical protein